MARPERAVRHSVHTHSPAAQRINELLYKWGRRSREQTERDKQQEILERRYGL